MANDKLTEKIKMREQANKMAPFPLYDTEIINDIKQLNMITTKDSSNNDPITFCKTCLSIHIKTVDFDPTEDGEERSVDYCVPCGNTDLDTTHISEWEDMYEERYGERFLTERKDKDNEKYS